MAINGDVAQAQRERTVNQLKSGKLDILVATDVAARGLDVERISHVVNYDIPTDTESYVHRIGRTGRAGRSGDAISFVTPRERYLLKHIEKATRQPLTQMQLPSVEDVNTTRLARFDEAITEALTQTDRIDRFRDIIGHYVQENDVPEVDVAAAIAVVMQGDTPLLLDPEAERPVRQERSYDDDRGPEPPQGLLGPRRARRRASRAGAPTSRWRRTGSRSASGTRSSPARSSAPSPTRAGCRRQDFGHIDIRGDHSLVELPADLPGDAWSKLSGDPDLRQADRAGARAERRRPPARVAASRAASRAPGETAAGTEADPVTDAAPDRSALPGAVAPSPRVSAATQWVWPPSLGGPRWRLTVPASAAALARRPSRAGRAARRRRRPRTPRPRRTSPSATPTPRAPAPAATSPTAPPASARRTPIPA